MSDRFRFDFEPNVWQNLRRAIRVLGEASLFFRFLFRLNAVLEERAARASWLYRQQTIADADGEGLDWWGIRRELPRKKNPDESDDDYLARLLINEALINAGSTIAVKKQIVAGQTGQSGVTIRNVYRSTDHQNMFRIGGPIGAPQFSRAYILFRYRIALTRLSDSFDREKLNAAIERINIGGNWPEFREDQGPFNAFGMGRPITLLQASRRSSQTRKTRVF